MDITFGSSKVHTYIHYVDQSKIDKRRKDCGKACCSQIVEPQTESPPFSIDEDAEIKSRILSATRIKSRRALAPLPILPVEKR